MTSAQPFAYWGDEDPPRDLPLLPRGRVAWSCFLLAFLASMLLLVAVVDAYTTLHTWLWGWLLPDWTSTIGTLVLTLTYNWPRRVNGRRCALQMRVAASCERWLLKVLS